MDSMHRTFFFDSLFTLYIRLTVGYFLIMRPNVVLGIVLAAACVLALVVMLPKKTNMAPATPTPSASAPEADVKPIPVPVPMAATPAPAIPAVVTNTDTNAIALAREKHAEYVEKRRDELMAMAMLDDTASHQPIIEALTNSDRAIRKVALEAVQQTQDRALIPQMQQIADTTDDEDYKQALDDAIDYMKLPTLTEMRKTQQAQQQNGGGNPSTQPPPKANPSSQNPSMRPTPPQNPGANPGGPPLPPGQGQP